MSKNGFSAIIALENMEKLGKIVLEKKWPPCNLRINGLNWVCFTCAAVISIVLYLFLRSVYKVNRSRLLPSHSDPEIRMVWIECSIVSKYFQPFLLLVQHLDTWSKTMNIPLDLLALNFSDEIIWMNASIVLDFQQSFSIMLSLIFTKITPSQFKVWSINYIE